jgi:ferrous iron transport protein A
MRLTDTELDQAAIVTTLHTQDSRLINKLLAMGIAPGVAVVVERRFPSYIIRIGQSRAAVDEAIAQLIEIQLDS